LVADLAGNSQTGPSIMDITRTCTGHGIVVEI